MVDDSDAEQRERTKSTFKFFGLLVLLLVLSAVGFVFCTLGGESLMSG